MSEAQFNELVKKMLHFQTRNIETETKEIDINEKVNDLHIENKTEENEVKTNILPRKERRMQDRVAKRLQKIKNKRENLRKEKNQKLQEAKEEHKKSDFSVEDKKRIEKILYNK